MQSFCATTRRAPPSALGGGWRGSNRWARSLAAACAQAALCTRVPLPLVLLVPRDTSLCCLCMCVLIKTASWFCECARVRNQPPVRSVTNNIVCGWNETVAVVCFSPTFSHCARGKRGRLALTRQLPPPHTHTTTHHARRHQRGRPRHVRPRADRDCGGGAGAARRGRRARGAGGAGAAGTGTVPCATVGGGDVDAGETK